MPGDHGEACRSVDSGLLKGAFGMRGVARAVWVVVSILFLDVLWAELSGMDNRGAS